MNHANYADYHIFQPLPTLRIAMTETAFDLEKGTLVYRRLLGYALPYWRMFVIAVIGMVIYAAMEPTFAALMKVMLDESFVERDPKVIRMIPVWLILIFIVRGITSFMSTYCTRWVGRRVVADLRTSMFSHMMRLPTTFFDNSSSGILLSKLIYDVEQVAQATTHAVTILIRDTVSIIALLGYMFYVNAMLSGIFLFVGPAIALLVRYISSRFRRISRSIQRSMGSVTHVAEEAIEGQRVVKSFGGAELEMANFKSVNEKNRHLNMKMIATDAASVPIIQLMSASALAGIVYLASLESMRETVSVGTFMSFIIAMGMLLSPIKRLTSVNAYLQKGIAAGQIIFELLDRPRETDDGQCSLDRAKGKIEFKQVEHTYSADKGPVLKNINLTIMPGQTVALIGQSGSGKTTLVNLLSRLYEVTEGSILVDDTDIRDYRLLDLRKQISVVSQDIILFNDTIARNIAYGQMRNASTASIEAAAIAANAMTFIEKLPMGLNTLIGENGVLLSGGQRQRLAIARAILKDAPLLILDEATAALDTESERCIQANLDNLMQACTSLVIAHRLSTIENADIIVVMHNGEIVEMGKHKDLLALNGSYSNLYKMQFRNDDSNVD